MDKQKLIEDLKRHEGFIPYAYVCTSGFLTIGYGTLIDQKAGGGIPEDICALILARHVDDNVDKVNTVMPWLKKHPEHVQRAVHNMCYQMGVTGVLKFAKTLGMIKEGKYHAAADNALLSKWAKQTPKRAKEVTDLLRGVS
jgi:lysozyme